MENTIQTLAYLFRASRNTRPVLLLGAGDSFRSGIPMAGKATGHIARAAYSRQFLGVDEKLGNPKPSDWIPFLQRQPWFVSDPKRFAENFPLRPVELVQGLGELRQERIRAARRGRRSQRPIEPNEGHAQVEGHGLAGGGLLRRREAIQAHCHALDEEGPGQPDKSAQVEVGAEGGAAQQGEVDQAADQVVDRGPQQPDVAPAVVRPGVEQESA